MSTDRHEPLDADEREFARVLRALPAGEPPSALDARILGMARDAVVTSPSARDEAHPRRAPRFAWGLGVAASCVLAAGLVWRLGGFGLDAVDGVGMATVTEAADATPPAESAQPAAAMPPVENEHIAVEFGAPRREREELAPPPPPPPPAAMSAPAPAPLAERIATPRSQAAKSVAPVEAPPTPEVLMDRSGPAERDAASASAPAEALADSAEDATLDQITVTGTRIADSGARPVSEDGRAGPQNWLLRIRSRIEDGDRVGARESLNAFVATYPNKPLPPDLIAFRDAEERP